MTSSLPGNPHADEALISTMGNGVSQLRYATLALAHEQRTASIIALLAMSRNMTHERHHNSPVTEEQFQQLRRDLATRLGLTQEVSK